MSNSEMNTFLRSGQASASPTEKKEELGTNPEVVVDRLDDLASSLKSSLREIDALRSAFAPEDVEEEEG